MVVHHPSKLIVPVRFWSLAPRPHRPWVRIPGFHLGEQGSSPCGATNSRSSNGRTTAFEAVNHSSSLCLEAFDFHSL